MDEPTPEPAAAPKAKTARRKSSTIRPMEDLHTQIPRDLSNSLRTYAAAKRLSQRVIVEQALRTFLHPRSEDSRDAMIARRLQRIDMKLLSLTEGDKLNIETVGMLTQVLLGLLPEPVTNQETREFRDKMARRWPRFMDALTDVLVSGKRGIYSELPKGMVPTAGDFAAAPDGLAPLNPDDSAPAPPTP